MEVFLKISILSFIGVVFMKNITKLLQISNIKARLLSEENRSLSYLLKSTFTIFIRLVTINRLIPAA